MEYYDDAEILNYTSLPQGLTKKHRKNCKARELCAVYNPTGMMPEAGDADRRFEAYYMTSARSKDNKAGQLEHNALPCTACQQPNDTDSNRSARSKCSARELRNIVQNQCKLHEVIVGVLDALNKNYENDIKASGQADAEAKPVKCNLPQTKTTATTEKCQCLQQEYSTISPEDLVEVKLINPLIRKFHHIYLENIQKELALLEELEQLPHRVNELYKCTIFKLAKND